MKHPPTQGFFWKNLVALIDEHRRLADVFRMVSFTPNESYGPHLHRRIEINYIKKGKCSIHTAKESVCFKENEIMIISSNITHYFQAGNEGALLMQLEFLPDIFSALGVEELQQNSDTKIADMLGSETGVLKIVNHVGIMRTIQRIINELSLREEYHSHLVLMYYAELAVLISRHLKSTHWHRQLHPALQQAILHIQEHYPTHIGVAQLAHHCGISERYLHKLFVATLGCSPLEYLLQIRLAKAVELLNSTDLSIKQISFSCGFRSAAYFSLQFKRKTGLSPKHFSLCKE